MFPNMLLLLLNIGWPGLSCWCMGLWKGDPMMAGWGEGVPWVTRYPPNKLKLAGEWSARTNERR